MKGLSHTAQHRVTSLDWDAEAWELYGSDGRSQMAARNLNRTFINAVNKLDSTRDSVRREMDALMRRYGDLGAQDSEPMWHLDKLLDEVFGR